MSRIPNPVGVQLPPLTRLAALVACALAPAFSAAQTLDLMQAYTAALSHDPTFRVARAVRDASLEEENLGLAQLLPTVTASISTQRDQLRANEREVLRGSGSNLTNSIEQSDTTTDLERSTPDALPTNSRLYTTSSTREARDSTSSIQTLSEESILESSRLSTTSSALQLRQPIINFGAFAAYRQGVSLTAAGQARFRIQQQELMVRVTEAYAQTLFSTDNQRLAKAQLQTLDEQQNTNERLLARGEGTLTDVLETRSKRELAQAQLIEADDNLATARRRLQALTGLVFSELAPIDAVGVTDQEISLTTADWRALALAQNGLLESLRHQVTAAREEARRADAGHYPRLELVATLARDERRQSALLDSNLITSSNRSGSTVGSNTTNATRTTTSNLSSTPSIANSSETTSATSQFSSESGSSANTDNADSNRRNSSSRRIGLELNIPLFAGGSVSARVRQTAARLAQAEAEMDAREDEVMLELERQQRLHQSTALRVRALQQAVESNRVLIDATVKSMAAGVRTNLDLLNARERLSAAERELANARYSHLLAYMRLRFNAGVLAEADLQRVMVK